MSNSDEGAVGLVESPGATEMADAMMKAGNVGAFAKQRSGGGR
jgi:microcompartment protein CcmL/EutN